MSSSEKILKKGEYEVEDIMGDRINRKIDEKTGNQIYIREFLIKWVGYKRRSWEPIENLEGCKAILRNYINKKKNHFMDKCEKNSKTPYKINSNSIYRYKNNFINNNITNNRRSPYLSEDDDKSCILKSFKSCLNKRSKSKKKLNTRKLYKQKNKKKEKVINEDFDIDIENDEKYSPFSKINTNNIRNEPESESTVCMNVEEKLKNDKYLKNSNLDKKRKRSGSSSDFSISIEDPFMKAENGSQSNTSDFSNFNNSYNTNSNKCFGIKISIPSKENDPINISCKIENNNKKLKVEGTSKNINVLSKDEIIECYEKILRSYLGGKDINILNIK